MLRLLLVASVAFALGPDLSAGSTVGVYLDFEQRPSEQAAAVMRTQAADALREIGFHIKWRLVSENQGTEAFERMVVVKFAGTCACRGIIHSTREILILGSTGIAGGQVRRVLTGSTHHAASGLATAIQSTDDLKSNDFSFGSSELR